jgi:nucleoside phosphorylase
LNSDPAVPAVLIIAAMSEEVAALERRLASVARVQRLTGGARLTVGWLRGQPIAIGVTGDGHRRASSGVEALLAAVPAVPVLVVGLAGALQGALAVESLVVVDRVYASHQPLTELRCTGPLPVKAAAALGAPVATLLSHDRLADTVDGKRALGGQAASPSVVDLETFFYAAKLQQAGRPWLVIRAISDAADEALPAVLNGARDGGGSIVRARVALALLREPLLLVRLLRLRGRMLRCAEQLALAAQTVLPTLLAHGKPPKVAAPRRAPLPMAVEREVHA